MEGTTLKSPPGQVTSLSRLLPYFRGEDALCLDPGLLRCLLRPSYPAKRLVTCDSYRVTLARVQFPCFAVLQSLQVIVLRLSPDLALGIKVTSSRILSVQAEF